jgi:hypothetical protein
MFSPETPPHSKYHRTTPAPKKDELDLWWLKRIFQILFIVAGVAAIAVMIIYGPKQKNLVCDKSLGTRGSSLIGFGSCEAK